MKLQDCVKLLPVSSAPATVHVAATPKKQCPALSSRHTTDDLKSGDYKYIMEDSEPFIFFIFTTMQQLKYF